MSVEAGKLMKEQGGGAIVNTASVNALQPGDRQGIYSITKAAVVNMTKAFAKECGPLGIRVNALLRVLPRPNLLRHYLKMKIFIKAGWTQFHYAVTQNHVKWQVPYCI